MWRDGSGTLRRHEWRLRRPNLGSAKVLILQNIHSVVEKCLGDLIEPSCPLFFAWTVYERVPLMSFRFRSNPLGREVTALVPWRKLR